MERVISFFGRQQCRVAMHRTIFSAQTWTWSTLYPLQDKMQGPLQSPPITTSVIVWEPGLAPAPQNFNRNHERGGFFKGFINCDQPPSAVTHVIQAAVMTPSKGCPQGGRRQGGGYKGNRASEVSHLPLNRSRTPSAGGGQGQL